VLTRAEPPGRIAHPALETIRPGEAAGVLTGGTLTQLAASLGTPYAFDPPPGHILFVDEVAERPYRIDRLLTQLRFAGILAAASAIVFGELPRCDEPGGHGPAIRDVLRDLLADFRGPVLFGLPSGHTTGACLTLPFGVRAQVVTRPDPALIIEEAAVA
jgi:muramoyltetrapeptide carboxypeptidase